MLKTMNPDVRIGEVFLAVRVEGPRIITVISAHASEESAERKMYDLGETLPCGGDKHLILRLEVEE